MDGYPRSASQAEALEKAKIRPDLFLQVNVPDEKLIERVVGRRQDPETGDWFLRHVENYAPLRGNLTGGAFPEAQHTFFPWW